MSGLAVLAAAELEHRWAAIGDSPVALLHIDPLLCDAPSSQEMPMRDKNPDWL